MKNESIVEAWDRLDPDAAAEDRVLARIEEKQARRRRSLRWAIPAAAAAAVALAILAGTVFVPESGNAFTVQAYALEEDGEGLRETDLYDQSAGVGGYYDGERMFFSIGLRYEGRNIESVTFTAETGFFAAQHISDYGEASPANISEAHVSDASEIHVGPDEKLVMIGETFDILGPEIAFEGAMDDDLLLFWGMESPDGEYIPDSIELTAAVKFADGETQTLPVSVPLKGEGVGPGVIAYAPDQNEAKNYVTQIEYYASLPVDAWILLEDSVAPVTDGWYEYFWEEESNDIQVQVDGGRDFDEEGNFISVHPGLKVVIHWEDDGSMTGRVYRVRDELRYDPEE